MDMSSAHSSAARKLSNTSSRGDSLRSCTDASGAPSGDAARWHSEGAWAARPRGGRGAKPVFSRVAVPGGGFRPRIRIATRSAAIRPDGTRHAVRRLLRGTRHAVRRLLRRLLLVFDVSDAVEASPRPRRSVRRESDDAKRMSSYVRYSRAPHCVRGWVCVCDEERESPRASCASSKPPANVCAIAISIPRPARLSRRATSHDSSPHEHVANGILCARRFKSSAATFSTSARLAAPRPNPSVSRMDAYQGPATGGSSASSSGRVGFFFGSFAIGVEPRADVHVRVDTARARGSFASFDVAANDGKTETDVDRPGLVPVSVSIVSVPVSVSIVSVSIVSVSATLEVQLEHDSGEKSCVSQKSRQSSAWNSRREDDRDGRKRARSLGRVSSGRIRDEDGDGGEAGRVNQGEHTREPGGASRRAGHRHSAAARSAWTTPRSSEFESRSLSRRGVARGEAETERGGGRGGVARVFADTHRGGTRRRGTRAAVLGGARTTRAPPRSGRQGSRAPTPPSRSARRASRAPCSGCSPCREGETSWRPIRAVERTTASGEDRAPRKTKRRLGRREGARGVARSGREPRRRPAGGGRAGGGEMLAPVVVVSAEGCRPPGRGSRTRLGAKGGQTSARPRNRPRERHSRLACHGGINGEIDRPTWVRPAFFSAGSNREKSTVHDSSNVLAGLVSSATCQIQISRLSDSRRCSPHATALARGRHVGAPGVSPVVVAIGGAAAVGGSHARVSLRWWFSRSEPPSFQQRDPRGQDAEVPRAAWRGRRRRAHRGGRRRLGRGVPLVLPRGGEDTSWTRTDAP